jgi:hypothetical protein
LQFAEFDIAVKNVGRVACGSRIGEHDFKLSFGRVRIRRLRR